jgi:hypothetical protein
VFAGGRPNLLVIDEIDGAIGGEGRGAVDAILKLLARDKKGKSRPVSRPIICICNDLYVPALRQLREEALVFRMHEVRSRVVFFRGYGLDWQHRTAHQILSALFSCIVSLCLYALSRLALLRCACRTCLLLLVGWARYFNEASHLHMWAGKTADCAGYPPCSL